MSTTKARSTRTNNGTTAKKQTAAAKPATTEPKKGIVAKLIDGCQRKIIQIKATKAGRIVIRVSKAAAVGGLGYITYRAGQRSAKPTTVYIESGCSEEENPAEEEQKADDEPINEEPMQEHD